MHEENEPMTFEMKLKGCPYRDSKDFRIFMMAHDLYGELYDLDQEIRARIKYTEGLSESESRFLEGLRANMDTLHLIE
jgi:hypothetical protein